MELFTDMIQRCLCPIIPVRIVYSDIVIPIILFALFYDKTYTVFIKVKTSNNGFRCFIKKKKLLKSFVLTTPK